ncbi:hypothetical protein KI387_038901, partial [Taxus chinensis]
MAEDVSPYESDLDNDVALEQPDVECKPEDQTPLTVKAVEMPMSIAAMPWLDHLDTFKFFPYLCLCLAVLAIAASALQGLESAAPSRNTTQLVGVTGYKITIILIYFHCSRIIICLSVWKVNIAIGPCFVEEFELLEEQCDESITVFDSEKFLQKRRNSNGSWRSTSWKSALRLADLTEMLRGLQERLDITEIAQ